MLIPHLHFCGDCAEAIALYEKAFNPKTDVLFYSGDGDGSIGRAIMRVHGLACYEIMKPGSITIDPLEELPYSKLAVQFIDKFCVQWGFMVEE